MSLPIKVIQLSGILSHLQAKQFRQNIAKLIEAGAIEVLIDFEQVTFMDSAGLGALVSVLKLVNGADGTVSLCSVRQEVRMLLELADVAQFFEIFPDREAFYQTKANCSAI
ncbi:MULTISPECIES: STAS domain-containing protein [Leptolyngbya]|uniref:STAS domain-containing protein n=1 Tax=Leptolyngbya TaxID=47251 RepID=UPI0016820A01|nr:MULTISPECIES: STAS domain-containing protein [unclassified Leptolyngbya]MBD1854117.1 STAS domain-containing protein [Leptolyngbya sp. FACHB-1624]MBN8560877.1 STAS domain-containing protein [Leptolyngbya sp. UWPOB_LEPTO1]